MKHETGRIVRLLIVVVLLLGAMMLPLVYMKNLTQDPQSDPAYHALWVYGQSLAGNSNWDGEAVQLYPSLTKHEQDGKDTWTRANKDTCWELDPSESNIPQKVSMEKCTS